MDYRYPCDVGRGTCYGRDYVAPDLWERLEVGQAVNMRRADDEDRKARLDENPQRGLALAQVGISLLFLTAAGRVSGRLKLSPARQMYVTASAVVTGVERVDYRDATRWKVRFAYFDGNGHAQESADEVAQARWKPSDECVAVFRPEAPDVATLHS